MSKTEGAIGSYELLAFIDHEVRNSTTRIIGDAASLRRGAWSGDQGQFDDDAASTAHRIEEEAQSLANFVGVLTKVAREDMKQCLEPTLLQRVLPRLIARLEPAFGGREVALNLSQDLPPVLANEALLEAVFKNVLSNAGKYSPPFEPISIDAQTHGDAVVVLVRNKGSVAPDELERLFEMAYRSRSVAADTEGSGVGLAECRALLRFMGGSIVALLPEEGGFEVRLSLTRIEGL